MNDLVLADTLILVASVMTAITVVLVFIAKGFKIIKKFIHFLDDFVGEEERPGAERRPGISERLMGLETSVSDIQIKFDSINDKVIFIEKELHPNHGTSMRDAVDRIQMRIDLVEEKITNHVNNN